MRLTLGVSDGKLSGELSEKRMTMAKKIAVVTDSNSGVTQSQAKELGLYVLPMPFMINEEPFYEDITLSQEQFYQKL